MCNCKVSGVCPALCKITPRTTLLAEHTQHSSPEQQAHCSPNPVILSQSHRFCPSVSPNTPVSAAAISLQQAWRCCRPAGWLRAPLGWRRPHTASCSRSEAWLPPAAGQQQQQHNPWRRSRTRQQQPSSSSKQEGGRRSAGGPSWASFAQTGREHTAGQGGRYT